MASSIMDPAVEIELKGLSLQKSMNDQIDRGDSTVQQFYSGVTVFVTGGSGFIGKQLIEKLFRSCVIKKMYLLMRVKKTITIQERLQQILKDPVFDLVYKKNPSFSERIELVEGDVTKIRMGINDKQWSQLTEEVNVIFHVAATTKFNAPLREATLTNVRGTREVLALARKCSEFKSFVYVSTAYTHATKDRVGKEFLEQFYPYPVPPETLIKLAEDVDENRLNGITENLINGWPNTYTYTKAAAEEMIRTTAGDLPICIVRPPIVVPAYCEPAPGWLDISTIFGPSGFILGTLLGALHVFLADKSLGLAMAPVDYVNNVTIVAPWDAAERRRNGDANIPVYNVTNKDSCISCSRVHVTLVNSHKDICSPRAIWYCGAVVTSNKHLYRILTWFLHYIPAYLLDKFYDLLGNKPKNIKSFLKLFKKFDEFLTVYGHFLFNSWDFKNDNVTAMISKMSDTDRAIFNCDLSTLDVEDYIRIWSIGLRKYIIKDGLTGTRAAYKRQFIYLTVNCVFLFGIIYLLWELILFVKIVLKM